MGPQMDVPNLKGERFYPDEKEPLSKIDEVFAGYLLWPTIATI